MSDIRFHISKTSHGGGWIVRVVSICRGSLFVRHWQYFPTWQAAVDELQSLWRAEVRCDE